jgi:hypothetical protein
MARFTVNEKSTAYLTVECLDKNGAAAAPSALSYQIHDVASGEEVRAPTALGAAAEVEITLTPADNTLVNTSRDRETRRVTISATYGASDQVHDVYEYDVKNLVAIALPSLHQPPGPRAARSGRVPPLAAKIIEMDL